MSEVLTLSNDSVLEDTDVTTQEADLAFEDVVSELDPRLQQIGTILLNATDEAGFQSAR